MTSKPWFFLLFTSCLLVSRGVTLDRPSKVLESFYNDEISEDLKSYYEEKIKQFTIDLHRSYETSRLRSKRDAGTAVKFIYEIANSVDRDPSGTRNLTSEPILCWKFIETPLYQYVLITTSKNDLILFSFAAGQFSVVFHIKMDHPAYRAEAFTYGTWVWFIINHGTDEQFYAQMYSYDGHNLYKRQKIQLAGYSVLELLPHRGVWYMAVGSTTSSRNQIGKLSLFGWRNTQFDLLAEARVSGIQAISMWEFSGIIYIAVAQLEGVKTEGSLIFSYHRRNLGKLFYHQQLSGVFAHSTAHYSIGKNHYLLFLMRESVSIYWWTGEELLLYQTIYEASNARSAEAVILASGEVAIAITLERSIMIWMEDLSSNYVNSLTLNVPNGVVLSSGGFISHLGSYYLFLVYDASQMDKTQHTTWADVRSLDSVSITKERENLDSLSSCLVSLENNIAHHKAELDKIDLKANKIWVTDKEQRVTATVFIKGDMEIAKPLIVSRVILHNNSTNISPLTNSELKNDIFREQSVADTLKTGTGDLVFKSRHQTITGPLSFLTPPVIGTGKLSLDQRISVLNDVDTSKLQSVLKINGDQVFQAEVSLKELSADSMAIDGTLNKIHFQDLFILSDIQQNVSGQILFRDISVQELNIPESGTVNSLKTQSLVLSNKPSSISGRKIFAYLITKNDFKVRGNTNGRNLSSLSQRIVSIREVEHQVGDVSFAAPLHINGNLQVNKLLNGLVNLTKLMNEALRLDKDQEVFGPKTFRSPVRVNSDVHVINLTNGIDVDSDVLTLDTPQTVPNLLTFLDQVNFAGDIDTLIVNEVNLSEEAVTRFGVQHITGHKQFTSPFRVTGDATLASDSLINGVRISNLGRFMATDNNFTLFGPVTIFNEVTAKYVDYISEINGMAIDGSRSVFWRKSLSQEIPVPLRLSRPVTFNKDVKVGNSVNGLNLDNSFAHTFGNEFIDGPWSFTTDVYIENALQIENGALLNNYDVTSYGKVVINSHTTRNIFGQKKFSNLVVKGNVIVNSSLNGIPSTEKFVLASKPQDITGHIHFKNSLTQIAGNFIVDNVLLQHDINGLDFSVFAKEVVLQNDTRNIPIEYKTFAAPLKVQKINSDGTIDSVDVTEFKRRALPLNSSLSQFSSYNFTDMTLKTSVSVRKFNGEPLEEFIDRVVVEGETEIRGSKTVIGSVKARGGLLYKGHLNGIDLPKLVKETASRTSNNFSSPVTVIGDLVIETIWVSDSTKIDGVPWSDVSFLNKEESFTGNIIFLDDIVAERRVTVEGSINECKVKDVVSQLIFNDEEKQTVEGKLSIGNLVVNGNLTVLKDINNINITRLALEMVTRSAPQRLTGDIVFKSGVVVKKLILKSAINAVNLSYILGDSVSKTSPQVISGVKMFTNLAGLAIEGDLQLNGNAFPKYIDGLDITRLRETTVLNFADQTIAGRKRFSDVIVNGNVHIQGYLNGVNFPTEVVLKHVADVVPIEVQVLGETTISGSIEAKKFVDGFHLNDIIHQRVSLSQQEVIKAELSFLKDIHTKELYVTSAVNDIPATSIVTRSKDYVINGAKHVQGNVIIEQNMEGCSINNISLPVLEQQVIRIDKEEVVSGSTIFISPLEINRNIIVESSINGLHIKALQKEFSVYDQKLADLSHQIIKVTDSQEVEIDGLFQSHQTCGFKLFSYFDVVQILDIPTVKLFSSPDVMSQNLVDSAASTNRLYGWSPGVCNDLDHCCLMSTVSIDLDGSGQLTVSEQKNNQRLFPFLFNERPDNIQALQGFFLWTNSTSPGHGCSLNSEEETRIVSIDKSSRVNLDNQMSSSAFQIKQSPFIQDADLFEVQGQLYMIIAYSLDATDDIDGKTGIEIYRYERNLDLWKFHQNIPALGVNDIDVIEIDYGLTGQTNCVLLAVASKPPGVSHIYTWIMELGQFERLSSVPSSWPSAVLWLTVDDIVYVIFANEKSVVGHDIPMYFEPLSIFIYDHDNRRMQRWQNIPVSGISSLATFKLEEETYILAGSVHNQLIYVIQWKGFGGFKVIQEFSIPGLRDLHIYWTSRNEMFLAVSSVCGTTILKTVTDGSRLNDEEINNYYNLFNHAAA